MQNINILVTLHVLSILQIVNARHKAGTNQHYISKFLHVCIIVMYFTLKEFLKYVLPQMLSVALRHADHLKQDFRIPWRIQKSWRGVP